MSPIPINLCGVNVACHRQVRHTVVLHLVVGRWFLERRYKWLRLQLPLLANVRKGTVVLWPLFGLSPEKRAGLKITLKEVFLNNFN